MKRLLFVIAALLLSVANYLAAQPEGALQIADLGTCKLESGAVLAHCRLGYRTFGHLNAAHDNAVLMPTWLYGTSKDLVGLFGDGSSPSHLVDTSRFFGIAIDAFANGVSSSPSNSETQHGPDFPAITTRDMVNAEYRVMTEVLGLKHLHAVLGLSMGGEQTFVWAAAYPGFFDLAVPILGTPRLTSYDLQVKQIQLGTIAADPGFNGGHYTVQPALKLANLFGALTVTTPEYRNAQTPRDHFGEFLQAAEAPQAIDANDRVAQIQAVIRHDAIGNRTLEEAAHAATAKFLVIVSAEDHLVNPAPALAWAAALHAPTYISHGSCAHIIMSCDAAAVSSRVREFLATGALH
jgi:homoserine O-acetyltransferase